LTSLEEKTSNEKRQRDWLVLEGQWKIKCHIHRKHQDVSGERDAREFTRTRENGKHGDPQ